MGIRLNRCSVKPLFFHQSLGERFYRVRLYHKKKLFHLTEIVNKIFLFKIWETKLNEYSLEKYSFKSKISTYQFFIISNKLLLDWILKLKYLIRVNILVLIFMLKTSWSNLTKKILTKRSRTCKFCCTLVHFVFTQTFFKYLQIFFAFYLLKCIFHV